MNNSKDNINWRREKVLEYLSKYGKQRDVAAKLMCSQSTISKDIAYLKGCSKENIKHFVDDLTFQYELAIEGLTNIINELWKDAENPHSSDRTRQTALSLALHAYTEKVKILDSAPLVNKAAQHVNNSKEPLVLNKENTEVRKDIH